MKAALSIVLLLALLVACAQQNEPQAAPIRPPAEPVAQPESAPENIPESGTDKVFDPVNKTTALEIDSVVCDPKERKISFAFKNTDTKNWQMNQQVPFPEPKDLAAVRVYINSYEVNGRNPYIVNGERMFGPEERFSDNCGGGEILAPGAVATCTLYPVPLKSANQLTAGKNEILIHSPTSKHIIQFTCE